MDALANQRLQQLPSPIDPRLVDDFAARDLMEFCSIAPEDQVAMLEARPDPDRDPDWWSLLSGCVAELRARMDKPLPSGGYVAWPLIPGQAGPVGMFVYVWALLAVVPNLLDVHQRRGIPEAVTRDTVAALGLVMTAHAESCGIRGVGLFPLWGPPQRMCGVDLTIGRHDFTRAEIGFGDGVAGYALQVHIPPSGRLDEAESITSISQVLEFFAKHYPDHPVSALVCKSWILDPQLGGYLSPESNLLRFQRRFRLLPHVPLDDVSEGDREMMRLGLQLQVPADGPLTEDDLRRVPADTTLHRAFVSHLRSGGHWHKRTGIVWLDR
ncbi:acyltransferase domain-containing protein [Microlunatus phosphovorus]|nr:acyltransferase domain-containing protein [Microlunatus phosphovorus]